MKLLVLLLLLSLFLQSVNSWSSEKDMERLKNCLNGRLLKVETEKAEGGAKETSYLRPVDCNKMAKEISESMDAKQAVTLAQTIGRESNWASSVSMYRTALMKGATCNEEGLKEAIKSGLDSEPTSTWAGDAKWIAFEKCKKESLKTVLEGMEGKTQGSYYRQNACEDLLKQNAIKGLNEKLCKNM